MSLRMTSSAFALIAMTAPAFADVTAEQVWQTWVDYYKSTGYTVTEGSREQAGESLTVKDIVLTHEQTGDVAMKITMTLPEVAMQQTGDGNVRTVYADTITGEFADTSDSESPVTAKFTISAPGNEMISSGTPEAMTHDFTYPTLGVTVDSVTSSEGEFAAPFKLNLANSVGKFQTEQGELPHYTYEMKTEKGDFAVDVQPESGEKLVASGTFEALEGNGEAKANPEMFKADADLNAALKAGMMVAGTLKSGPMAATFDMTATDENDQPTGASGKTDAKGFDLTFSMSQDGLVYQGGSDATNVEMTVPQMPFPLAYGVENGSFDIQIPIMKSDEAKPFKVAYSLGGLTISDSIWDMFDKEKALPRDPASLELDVTGLAQVSSDLMAMAEADLAAPTDEAAEEAQAEAFMPTEVTLNRFALALLGAKAEATGTVKAPENGDITTPVGQINARYENLNTLLENLGKTGLVPADQLNGARMMLAMFAKVDANDPNVMTTDIEMKEDGSVFANGQQIQ